MCVLYIEYFVPTSAYTTKVFKEILSYTVAGSCYYLINDSVCYCVIVSLCQLCYCVISLQRGSMLFELPVLLSTIFTGWTLTAGGLIPAVADAAVGWLLSSAWQRRSARSVIGSMSYHGPVETCRKGVEYPCQRYKYGELQCTGSTKYQ